jgi:signal transduction histidine kinase
VTVAANAVHSIFDNLLRNALNHCPPGSNVEVRLAQEDRSVRLDVLDDGPGMPPEERQRAFDRFFRGRGAGPGSGLGLAIVQQAAWQLGGSVSLAAAEKGAEKGRGLHVAVAWPARPEQSARPV